MKFIECKNVSFCYLKENDESSHIKKTFAVENIDLEISKGEFIVILGRNGSGKSTLAKLFNGLLRPSEGEVRVCSLSSLNDEDIWDIREKIGMVFQNPDNQIVAAVVEEDVAFGAENIGIKSEEIKARVKKALNDVDMERYAKTAPHLLSGGQKQRIAIAGVLAMNPECIIFDESTAMLDPAGRKKITEIISSLNKNENMTVILITHFMEEALLADRVFVMENGKIVSEGTPKMIFSDYEKIKSLGLDLPVGADIAYRLKKLGFKADNNIVYDSEIVDYIADNIDKDKLKALRKKINVKDSKDKIIEIKNMSYIYNENSVFERKALDNINIDIFKGEITAVIGKTGSGKSTFAQTLNGLIKPVGGKIIFNKKDIWESDFNIKDIRKHIGIVFQYPEYQLFEETIFKDAMFGPLNIGFSKEEAEKNVIEAFKTVGIDKELFDKSPFELSGGQKRRAAIAGVLSMKPDVLILDEPTAGLDPRGRDEILSHIKYMRDKMNITVIMISHSMEEVCKISNKIIVLKDGGVLTQGRLEDVFSKTDIMRESGIIPPYVNIIFKKLIEKGIPVPDDIYTVSDAVDFLRERL